MITKGEEREKMKETVCLLDYCMRKKKIFKGLKKIDIDNRDKNLECKCEVEISNNKKSNLAIIEFERRKNLEGYFCTARVSYSKKDIFEKIKKILNPLTYYTINK